MVMKEHTILMSTWYTTIGFGPPEVDYIGMEEGDEMRNVGGLLRFNTSRTGGFAIVTATHTGYVTVTIRSSHECSPPTVDVSEWEDMAISSFEAPLGELIAQNTGRDGETTPNLIDRPGTYGVRVLARNRDEPQPEDLTMTAPDVYLVDIWPAPPEGVPEESFSTSEIGKEIETWG